MEQEDITELRHLHLSWLENRYTQTFIKNIQQQCKDAFGALQSACRGTTDANVMYAYTLWYMLNECLKTINEGPRSDEQS